MEETSEQQGRMARFKAFLQECSRVLRVTRKPDRVEFVTIVKVSALGIALIGLVGFTMQMIKKYFFQ